MNLLAPMRYLVALHEHQHFGRAAQACHITQPALSNAIRALEADFGVVIVKRGRTYAGLTHEGEQVLRTAQRMLQEHELLRQELSHGAGHLTGCLRMAAVPTAVPVLSLFAAMLHRQHPGLRPVVMSMSSHDLEAGLENLSVDLGLGYTERMHLRSVPFTAWPQYTEHYYLLRRAESAAQDRGRSALAFGAPISWAEAAERALCLLTPDMHNRTIIDQAFADAGCEVVPAIETNSVLTLALAVLEGHMCSVLPGAMVGAVASNPELEALPLVAPQILTPIGFMTQAGVRVSRALEAALALLESPEWHVQRATHAGSLARESPHR
ncbi:LysR family transcriptional regulator [Variovorax sp. HJSM1_2]|uniref:LysR family transcriptional regulator n=1 Tax=Variovorax sp. HJSM1_2 TaxID=3366263 RepID=UPI003BC5B2CC